MIKKDYKFLFKKCFSCNSPEHLFEECPFLHFIPKKDTVIKKYLYYRPNSRDSEFKRKIHLKTNSNALKNFGRMKSLEKKSIGGKMSKLEAFFSMHINKNSSCLTLSVDEAENISYSEGEDIDKELLSQMKDKVNSGEIRKEEEKENYEKERENLEQENLKITFMREKSQLHQKEEFFKLFISNFELKRKILLNQSINEGLGSDLFDLEFEKAYKFQFYNKNDNYDKVLHEYKKSMNMKNKFQSQKIQRSRKKN